MHDINRMARDAYITTFERGILDGINTMAELKAATVEKLKEEVDEFEDSELSDVFDKNSEQSEIADIILIMMSYSYARGIDLYGAITGKMEFNKSRVQ